ncbi:MAG TPA: OmpA family protein [Geobacteraceae bacterium]|nr:OmpA family protein [Geobacteraceae bacterium]
MGYLHQLGFFFFFAIMPCISAAMAAEIHTSPYNYTYGKAAANSTDHETFVICELCPPRQLIALKPRMTALAVRVPEAAASITADGPPTGKQTVSAKAANNSSAVDITGSNRPDHVCVPTIYFRFNRFDVSNYEKDQLDRLVSRLKERPDRPRKIRVVGHTCDLGSDPYNDRLSLMRAEFVAVYLGRNGFKVSEAKGEGKRSPVSKVGKLNRRVEIEIIH